MTIKDKEIPDAITMNRRTKIRVALETERAIKQITSDIIQLARQGQFCWYDKNRLLEKWPEAKKHFKNKGYEIIGPTPLADDDSSVLRISWRDEFLKK